MVTKKGTITQINKDRGYGFIAPDDAHMADHFFNARAMHAQSKPFSALDVGDLVTFVSDELNQKGPRAIQVRADAQPKKKE